jgi:hypothetical protein
VAQYESSVSAGTHSLSGYDGDVYEPSHSAEAEARSYVLGGVASLSLEDSMDDRRLRILKAAEARLRKEEEELEDSCGTAGPSAVKDSAVSQS